MVKEYDSKKNYRLCTREEFNQDVEIQFNWCNINSPENMNFLFGVKLHPDLAKYIIEKGRTNGDFYALNPEHPEANHKTWTLYRIFVFEDKPIKIIPIKTYL